MLICYVVLWRCICGCQLSKSVLQLVLVLMPVPAVVLGIDIGLVATIQAHICIFCITTVGPGNALWSLSDLRSPDFARTTLTHTVNTTPMPRHTSLPKSALHYRTGHLSSRRHAARSGGHSPRRRTAHSRPDTTSMARSGRRSLRTPSSRRRTGDPPICATVFATRSLTSTRPRGTSRATPRRRSGSSLRSPHARPQTTRSP